MERETRRRAERRCVCDHAVPRISTKRQRPLYVTQVSERATTASQMRRECAEKHQVVRYEHLEQDSRRAMAMRGRSGCASERI